VFRVEIASDRDSILTAIADRAEEMPGMTTAPFTSCWPSTMPVTVSSSQLRLNRSFGISPHRSTTSARCRLYHRLAEARDPDIDVE
jgi:hypothetical protein